MRTPTARVPRGPIRRVPFMRGAAPLGFLLLLSLSTPAPSAAYPGLWSDPLTIASGRIAVHMVLMPADTADFTSQVLWWEGSDPSGFLGGLFLIRPTSDDPHAVLQKDFYLRGMATPGKNIFCAGHTHMADGSAFINGGTELEGAETGESHSYIYHPATRSFSGPAVPYMSQRRWYPTVTLLPDGRIASFSGSSFISVHVWGGLRDTGAVASDDSLHRFAIVDGGAWDRSVGRGSLDAGQWPLPREGHSSTYLGLQDAEFYFGGVDADGKSNTVWRLYRNEPVLLPDYDYHWVRTDPPGGSEAPAARTGHIGVAYDDSVLLVFGGLTDQGTTNDLWEFREEPDPNTGVKEWRWRSPAVEVGPKPGPRQGHVAFDDVEGHRVLIFGGSVDEAGTTLSGDTLWAVHLNAPGDSAVWSAVEVDSTTERPTARTGAALGADDFPRDYDTGVEVTRARRAAMVGGRLADGSLSDEVWLLWSLEDGTARWQRITSSNDPPPPRERAAAFLFASNRLYVMGGRLADGTRDNSVYTLSLVGAATGSGDNPWEQVASSGVGLAGHTARQWRTSEFARVPEVYDPASRTWSRLESAHLLQEWYPFMFLVPHAGPDPRLFFAGPADSTFMLDLDPITPSWTYVDRTPDFKGGSAVMFRVGRIMKCGSRETERIGQPALARTMTIDLTAPDPDTAHWVLRDSMGFGRVDHNLTILPDGKVLVTGGTGLVTDHPNPDPVLQPELWDPESYTWTAFDGPDSLPRSTIERGYHATALLLPDARVLCGGGYADSGNDNRFDVYSPPYLFKSDGSLRTRPKLLGLPGRLHYGDTITVHSDLALDRVVLLRPAAVTHAFNEDQRWVPLDTLWTGSTTNPASFTYTTRIPASKDSLPPGHYMLFGLLEDDTPSLARWVHLGDPPNAADIGDRAPPGPPTDLSLDHQLCDTVTLKFKVSADDSTYAGSGTPRRYHLRYRDGSAICDTCWTTFWAADSLEFGPDAAVGGWQYVPVPGLTVGHGYYFRLVAEDDRGAESGNRSFMSNQAWVHVLGCDGGGLGGVGVAALEGGVPTHGVPSATAENSLLLAPAAGPTRDALRLEREPEVPDGLAQAFVTHRGEGTVALDRVRLVALDHDGPGEPFVLGTRDLLGVRLWAPSITRPDGTSLAEAIAAAGSEGMPIGAGDTLMVRLAPGPGEREADVESLPLLLRASTERPGAAGGGIEVACDDGTGGWRRVATLQARRKLADVTLDAIGATRVRLVFLGAHRLSFVGRIAAAPGSLVRHALDPTDLVEGTSRRLDPSRLGDGGQGLVLAGDDTLRLGFEPPDLPQGLARTWFLAVTGRSAGAGAPGAPHDPPRPPVPSVFGLGRNRPNPFSRSTSIECSLPRASDLKVEVFDLSGRRVRVLASGYYEAGVHTLRWDRRDGRGVPAPAGVYLCRMRAGAFHAERKLILFP